MVELLDEKEFLRRKNKLDNEIKKAGDDVEVEEKPFTQEDFTNSLKDFYNLMNYILDYYMDLPEDSKNIVALWSLGTHFHDDFETFPYLFVNAMRGSGKTRLLKIIQSFAKNAQLTSLITEATMFRTTGTLLLDEFEGVGRKGNENLRELLNSAYKKGTKVFRMRKKKGLDGESQVVEDFQPYRPIVMANIWGMEEVLGDRCINILLEKSDDISKTKLTEDFKDMESIRFVKSSIHPKKPISTSINSGNVEMCIDRHEKHIASKWNIFVKQKTTSTSHTTHYTQLYTTLHQDEIRAKEMEELLKGNDVVSKDHTDLFERIYATDIDGRYLELFFPMFLTAARLSDEILERTLVFAKKTVDERKMEEQAESKDVGVFNLVATLESEKYYTVLELKNNFNLMMGGGENDWLNTKWLGLSLKRLNLVSRKKRTRTGVHVMLKVEKAKLKQKIFRPIGQKKDDEGNKDASS